MATTSWGRGELLFEAYLRRRHLGFQFEPKLGKSTRPDYLVRARTPVLCEVEDFGEGDIDRLLQPQLQAHGVASGAWDPFLRVRRKIRTAAKQLTPFKGQYPCVIVLHNPGYMVDMGNLVVLGSMFGTPVFRIPIRARGADIDEVGEPASGFSPQNRVFTPTQNTSISVVAVLEMIFPNRRILDDAASRYRETRENDGEAPFNERMVKMLEFLEQIQAQYRPGFFQRSVPRLRVFHNPHAVKPLPRRLFRGKHDIHIQLDRASGAFKTF